MSKKKTKIKDCENHNPIQKSIDNIKYKLWMFYYDVRNYTNIISHDTRPTWKENRRSSDVSTWVFWQLIKPLKIQYQVRTTGYHCKECDALDRDETNHLEYNRNFESYIWSKKIKYINTNCTCEKLLFAPLEDDPSALIAPDNCQWDIVEKGEVNYDKS